MQKATFNKSTTQTTIFWLNRKLTAGMRLEVQHEAPSLPSFIEILPERKIYDLEKIAPAACQEKPSLSGDISPKIPAD